VFKNFSSALILFFLADAARAEVLPRVLILCTDVSECGIAVGALRGEYSKTPETARKSEKGWNVELTWNGKVSVSVFQPRFGGFSQVNQLATLEERLEAERSAGKPYDLIIALGTAGGGGGARLGDLTAYATFEYLINETVPDILPVSPPIRDAAPPNWPDILSALKGMSLKPVPYNDAPRILTESPCVTVTAFTMGDRRKTLSEKFGCFQKNDYVTAVAAKKAKVPLLALRVISDVTPLPEQVVTSITDSMKWVTEGQGEKKKVNVEPLFYSKFKEIYLSQLYTVLPAVLDRWQKSIKR